jgi:membrane glycosyltransferase
MPDMGGPGAGVLLTRTVALIAAWAAGIGGFMLFLQFGAADGLDSMDIVRSALIFASTFWLAWGAFTALIGLTTRPPAVPRDMGALRGTTAILVPVYNEDPEATFVRIAAMDASLQETGLATHFHFAILSDTRNEQVAQAERHAFVRLLDLTGAEGRMFYRRRTQNKGRKAGNIEDFIKRSGAAYEFSIILDADSLMEGTTLVEMVRRMQGDPKLGLLQTLPVIIHAQSRFARAIQFAGTFYSPVFCRGLAMMQGKTGPFWGHNAIVRTRAFADSCGLPELSGKPPFGGHVLSHDYVEAALLARAGWTVRVDDDIAGSYEETPENIVDFAKRDRRWCQGNLQHSKIIGAPGLKPWSRFVFFQGILSYIAPVFWLGFILASIAAPLFAPPPDYFPVEDWPFPVLPVSQASKALGLAIGVVGLLFLPKLLILIDATLRGRTRSFGGALGAFGSVVTELVFSSLIAPVLLAYQTRSVAQVLRGADGGWPAQVRGDGSLSFGNAWAASHWITTTGVILLGASQWLSPVLVPWLLPVGLPMVYAPVIIWWSSKPSLTRVYLTPLERQPAAVMELQHLILGRWQGMEDPVENRALPDQAVIHA